MGVCVDEARQNASALEINDLGIGVGQCLDLVVAANGNKDTTFHSDSFGFALRWIRSPELTIDESHINLVRQTWGREQGNGQGST